MTSTIGVKKIQYPNGTDILTLDSSGSLAVAGTLGVTGAVTANAGVVVDNITIDGTEIDLSSGDLTLDVAGNIILDADGGVVRIYDGGTQIGNLANNSSALHINVSTQDKDFAVNGNDGGSTFTALTLDMSEAGHATFNSGATFGAQINGTNLSLSASSVPFLVNQTANNLTATFKGAGLGTMELEGTASGAFIDMKQGSNDYDVRFGANNTGGYAAMGSGANGFSFNFADGSGSGTVTVSGTLNKTSGSFRIAHPLESKKDTHHLFHSFVEGPQCDNLYRGKVTLSSGSATVNLDTKSGMTDGTFVALNRDIQCFTTNETGWTPIKGSVSGNVLTITAQDNSCTDTISWLVIGERQDDEIKASSLTDNDGNLVVEKLKSEAHDTNQNYGVIS